MRSRYPDYKSYADATITDIIAQDELDKAGHLTANELRTFVFLGSKDKFIPVDLPAEAQYSPVYATLAHDFNGDGHVDILLAGNNSRMKIKIGQLDANQGVLLYGSGDGGFQYVDQRTSGLAVKGDVRGLIMLGSDIWFSINERPIALYRMRSQALRPALANTQ
jgi:enediyne biosynthesis protein E4